MNNSPPATIRVLNQPLGHYRLLICLTFLSLLWGCAAIKTDSPVPPDSLAHWQAHQEKNASLENWVIEGRIFIQAREEGFSSRYSWQQTRGDFQIDFSIPQHGFYYLSGGENGTSLRLPNHEVYEAETPEELMKKTLGFKLPISGLQFWLRGIPAPVNSGKAITLDRDARLLKLEQEGWDIEVTRYILQKGYYLPQKLTMNSRHVKLKIAIKEWTLTD